MISYHRRPGSDPANGIKRLAVPAHAGQTGQAGVQNPYYPGPGRPGIMGI